MSPSRQGYSAVLGTAAQITTFTCISLRAYIGRQLPTGLEARDYALAAAGLLNFRGALVSCFAGLLFLLVGVSFVRAGCRTAGFHSIRGTTYYNIWKLVYERVEKSSTGEVLRFLVHNCGFLALAVAKVERPGAAAAMGMEPSETKADFTVSRHFIAPCPDPGPDPRPNWALVAQGAPDPLRQMLAANPYLSPKEDMAVSDRGAAASRPSRPDVARNLPAPSMLGPASPAPATNPYLPTEDMAVTSTNTVSGSAAPGTAAQVAASGDPAQAPPCATQLSDVGIAIRPQTPLREAALSASTSSVAHPAPPSAAPSLPSDVSVAIRSQSSTEEVVLSACIVPARCHPFEPDAAPRVSAGVRPSTPGSDGGDYGDGSAHDVKIKCGSSDDDREELDSLLEPEEACEPAGGKSNLNPLAAAHSLRRELGAERDTLLARASALAMSISALRVAGANTLQAQNLREKLEAERDDLLAQASALEVAIAGMERIGWA